MRSRLLASILMLIPLPATGQSAPRFEVTSVKRSGPSQSGGGGGVTVDGALFRSSRVPVRNLIYSAYGVPAWTVTGGPGWLDTDAYDISATLPPNTSREMIGPMLQGLLAERFNLVLHHEAREAPVYVLVVAKSGNKLQAADDAQFSVKRGKGHLELRHTTMEILVTYLSGGAAGLPVQNMTGVSGYFDVVLDWAPGDGQPDPADGRPSIFTAIQEQLGLKLEPRRATTDFLVIDRADRPAEN